jgi:hypothetical protein
MGNDDSGHQAQAEQVVFYRDRTGAPIDRGRWAELWKDPEYRFVAESRVEGTGVVVRTVWEGAVSPVSPMFATGISLDGGRHFITPPYGEEARTEEEALAQHERALSEAGFSNFAQHGRGCHGHGPQ